MAFTSTTKSWQVCNKDQRRECIAFAVFTKMSNFGAKAKAYVSSVRTQLLSKINLIKDIDENSLNPQEKELVGFMQRISEMGNDVATLEKIFPFIERFMNRAGIDPLSTDMTFPLLGDRKLSKLVDAIGQFKWTGSGTRIPFGKSEKSVGVSDSILSSLMTVCGADGLLNSWLIKGDAVWKNSVDIQIAQRKNEIKKLQRIDPKSGKIAALEWQIRTLERDWKL
ncbi:TPA: hypothetical protein DGH83_04515 [Candidatus Peregrinibacteria bacterium]|nr:hypothetical protein [Candidatus Peregrinibacteria bacterium]